MAKPGIQPIVTTITPLRISFLGGGTDLPSFYQNGSGAVVSTAINRYIYVTVKRHSRVFGENYRLNYSESEHAQDLDQIKNGIARECLRYVNAEPPIYISTIADLPAASGLGSSSSFAVGLLHALHLFKGEQVSAGQLAEEAAHIELNVLKRAMGRQDHYAAAFGGLNYIRFLPNDRVTLEPLWIPNDGMDQLFRHSLLFWTNQQRDAADILTEQRDNNSQLIEHLNAMREQAEQCRASLLQGFNPEELGALLHQGWQHKRRLSPRISNTAIDLWYRRALDAGAFGGKISGAGGGGFLYLLAPPQSHGAIRNALTGMEEVSLWHEARGTGVLSARGLQT